jgi:CBS domain-containing protein
MKMVCLPPSLLGFLLSHAIGFILEPAVLSPDNTIADLDALKATKKISGVPITSDGLMGSKLLGLCSRRDVDYIQDRSMKIRDVMTPLDQLVTGRYPLHITKAFQILKVMRFPSSFLIFACSGIQKRLSPSRG